MDQKDSFEFMIVGLGGMGALFAGRTLAETAMSKYKHVLYFPNYGPQMRLGDSECTVIISNQHIRSHCIMNPESVIVMGAIPLLKFESRMPPGGMMIFDGTVQPSTPSRSDVKTYSIPATQTATNLGDRLVANFVLLGAYVEATNVVPLEKIEKYLNVRMSGVKKEVALALNKAALWEGSRLMVESKN
ncbi:MAG: 2-oxoacid:acceptor oxidoreductase family protein [Thermodesulfobacteriota bacterium]|nr:2-oxoacid:acceptor oxidoreductase family protein [Thermodesulfobacteriota bacterium]